MSSVKKVKNLKKLEKALKDKGDGDRLESGTTNHLEKDGQYICSGRFADDFEALGKRKNLIYIPPVVQRDRRSQMDQLNKKNLSALQPPSVPPPTGGSNTNKNPVIQIKDEEEVFEKILSDKLTFSESADSMPFMININNSFKKHLESHPLKNLYNFVPKYEHRNPYEDLSPIEPLRELKLKLLPEIANNPFLLPVIKMKNQKKKKELKFTETVEDEPVKLSEKSQRSEMKSSEKTIKSSSTVRQNEIKEPENFDENHLNTFILESTNEYIKPRVSISIDVVNKIEHLSALHIKNWKIDVSIMEILKNCLSAAKHLTELYFWNNNFNTELLKLLSDVLIECKSLKRLNFDNNPLPNQDFHIMLPQQLTISHLSLRFCRLNREAVSEIAGRIGHPENSAFTKIISLDLTGNKIGDEQTIKIFDSLKFNRTLVSLNLADNELTDLSIRYLFQILTKFPLTHKELVKRRKLLWTTDVHQYLLNQTQDVVTKLSSSTIPHKKVTGNPTDRPISSMRKVGAASKASTQQSKKPTTKNAESSRKDVGNKKSNTGSSLNQSTASLAKVTNKRNIHSSQRVESSKKIRDKKSYGTEMEFVITDPNAQSENGKMYVAGNYCLLHLVVDSNKLSEESIKIFHEIIEWQKEQQMEKHSGLLRISYEINSVDERSIWSKRLNEKLIEIDPLNEENRRSTSRTDSQV
ncbi:hypothetical protein SNEBB_010378 [Seison nebaliae]|nr:hypothetical protein SNEBB_010378 [Seison nebaliae]